MSKKAFQDQVGGNHCWGCGPLNENGLQIKSYWLNETESICKWQPRSQFMAGPQHILNGGVIATLIDCHSVCTAIAAAYQAENRELTSPPLIWYVTGSLNVRYVQPTPLNQTVTLLAKIEKLAEKKTVLTCTLSSNGETCAIGDVVAVRVPPKWREST